MFSPASFVEGWAHYTEQMMVEAGFRRDDQTFKLGQLAEALIRLGRFIVSIRLHVQDWSVEQGVRFFRDECFMEESSARREAERGTFDPDLPRVFGRQADAAEAAAGLQGTAGREVLAARVPRSAARQRHRDVRRSSPADARRGERATCWSRTGRSPILLTVMPLYEYRMRRVRASLRADPEVLGFAGRGVPEMREDGRAEAAVQPGDSVQGIRLVHHRLRAKGASDGPADEARLQHRRQRTPKTPKAARTRKGSSDSKSSTDSKITDSKGSTDVIDVVDTASVRSKSKTP